MTASYLRHIGATAYRRLGCDKATLDALRTFESYNDPMKASASKEVLKNFLNSVQDVEIDLPRKLISKIFTGVSPQMDSWSEMPVQDRNDVRRQFDRITRNGIPSGYLVGRSGGSTGEPLHFLLPKKQRRQRRAASDYCREMAHWRPGVPIVALWGVDDFSGPRRASINRFKSLLRNQFTISAFAAGPEEFRQVESLARRLGSVVLYGYTSHLVRLAIWSSQHRSDLCDHLIGAWTGGESLDFNGAMSFSEAFDIPLQNFYGARESGPIGMSRTGRTDLLVPMPWVFVEVVDSSGVAVARGEEGDVLVTVIQSAGTPFIRYRIGDRAVSGGPDVAGVFSSRLLEVVGRLGDEIVLRDGRVLNSMFWHRIMKNYLSAGRYQVKVSGDAIELRMEGGLMDMEKEEIIRLIRGQVPWWSVRFTNEALFRTPIGKVPLVVSD